MFFNCIVVQNNINGLAIEFGLGKEDLLNSVSIQQPNNQVAEILMAACFFCAHIFSKNKKTFVLGALKNMARRFLQLASVRCKIVKDFCISVG